MMVIVCGSEKWTSMVNSEIKQGISAITTNNQEQLIRIIDKCDLHDSIFIIEESWLPLLLEKGVPQTRMIYPSLFDKLDFANPIMSFSGVYDSVLFGMSHAQCGIIENNLSISCIYKEAAPSLDLFLHWKYLKLLCKLHAGVVKKIQYYIFELPYYIFNYDLSRFGDFCYTKLNYFDQVDDYHHLGEKESQKKMIALYQHYKELFDSPVFYRKSEDINQNDKASLPRKAYRLVRNAIKIIYNKDDVWYKYYNKTIDENKKIWDDIQYTIHENSPDAQIIVLIMPFNPLFRITHKAVIKKQREIFFQNLGHQIIVDDFKWSHSYFDFKDHCHLKDELAEKYTKHLDIRLKTII